MNTDIPLGLRPCMLRALGLAKCNMSFLIMGYLCYFFVCGVLKLFRVCDGVCYFVSGGVCFVTFMTWQIFIILDYCVCL